MYEFFAAAFGLLFLASSFVPTGFFAATLVFDNDWSFKPMAFFGLVFCGGLMYGGDYLWQLSQYTNESFSACGWVALSMSGVVFLLGAVVWVYHTFLKPAATA